MEMLLVLNLDQDQMEIIYVLAPRRLLAGTPVCTHKYDPMLARERASRRALDRAHQSNAIESKHQRLHLHNPYICSRYYYDPLGNH